MKKFSKIFILLLSIALIVGAVAVVASANAGQGNVIELYANDVKVEGVTTMDAALLHVQKGQADGANYTVKLLGNITNFKGWTTEDKVCYAIGADAPHGGELVDNVARNTTFDLNGYTLDTTTAETWSAFISQRIYRNITITGSGTIIVGDKPLFSAMSGAQMSIKGTGYGIRIKNAEGTMPWSFDSGAGSGCGFYYENANFDFSRVETASTGKKLFVIGNYNHTFVNCRINLDITFTPEEGTEMQHYVFDLNGTGVAKLYNTAVVTTTHGIAQSGAGSELTIEGVTDNYVLYMENSSIYCDANEATIAHAAKLKEQAVTNSSYLLRTKLIVRAGTPSINPSGSYYIKNSYMGANYRLIQGQTADLDNSYTDHAVMTFDNSTLEHICKAYNAAGESQTNAGQGFYGNITYTNFINNSTVIFNNIGGWMCGGGGNTSVTNGTNYHGVVENGAYFIDAEIGTRFDKDCTAGKVDLPAGASVSSGTDGFLHVTDGSTSAPPISTVVHNNSTNKARPFGYYLTNQTVGGVKGVQTWKLPTETDTDYTKDAAHQASFADGNITLGGTDSYLYHGASVNLTDATVVVYTFDFYYEGNFPLGIILLGRGASARYMYQLNDVFKSLNIEAGKWHTWCSVVDFKTGACVVYLDGEEIRSLTGTTNGITKVEQYRIQLPTNSTSSQGASYSWTNTKTVIYGNYIGGEFNAKDYVVVPDSIANPQPVAYVGGQSFFSVSEALDYANQNNTFVTLAKDVTENITSLGYVYTNGYTFNPTVTAPMKMTAINDGEAYLFEGPAKFPVNWIVNDDLKFSAYAFEGMTLTALPEELNVPTVRYYGNTYEFKGWTTELVPYEGKTAEEYTALVEAATILTEAQILEAIVVGETNYYPVYEITDAVSFEAVVNGVSTYYGEDANISTVVTDSLKAGKPISIILHNNVTVSDRITSNDSYTRTKVAIDFNGYTMTVLNLQGFLIQTASGGQVVLSSSREGGKLVQKYDIENAQINPLFYIHLTASISFTNVDVEAYQLLYMSAGNDVKWTNGAYEYSYRDTKCTITGGTFTALDASSYMFNVLSSSPNANHKEFTVSDATFVGNKLFSFGGQANEKTLNKGNGNEVCTDVVLWFGNEAIFNNCTIVTETGADKFVTCSMAENNVTFNSCTILGTIDATKGVFNVAGNTAYYGADGELNCTSEGRSIAINAAKVTYGDKEYDVNFVVAADSEVKVANVYDLTGNLVASIKFINGVWSDYVTVNVEKITLDLLSIEHDGTWIEGEDGSYRPGTTITYAEDFANNGVYNNFEISTEGFNVYFYVAADYYQYLDDATKALLSETPVTVDGREYYVSAPIARNVNDAYTEAQFQIVVVDGGYTLPIDYKTTIADYLANALANTEGDEQELCYYVAAYVNAAYNYFTVVDDKEATAIATLVETYKNVADTTITLPTLTTDASQIAPFITISLDLTAVPQWVIVSSEQGTVTIGETSYELSDEEVLRIAINVADLDEIITITLDGGATGTYTLGDYAASIAEIEAGEVYTAELKALVEALYNYVLFANK